VGESGTIYRIFQFAAWQEQQRSPTAKPRKFIKSGSLIKRSITDNPDIINWDIEELLKLDGETTQWATAALLLRDEPLSSFTASDEPKFRLTAEAINHWYSARARCESWIPRRDHTINQQAASYCDALQTAEIKFTPRQAEDYCFARAYGLITPEEAEALWPKLRQHESDRIESMELAIWQAEHGMQIDVNDHRVVQAIAMRYGLGRSRFKYPDCVAKSWPLFWEFITKARDSQGVYDWQPS
jgi:hypothetical protein